ncbi:hypothetical protein PybrP1_005833 [[Pythium] brassicae (nom. inval.)]|nr:hypothetical protein PybrP1_005833 [[Pythium] brassicae (nom. inval.)]
MGGAASRTAARTATKHAARAAEGGSTKVSAPKSLSRDAVVVSHLDTSTRDLNGASLMRNPAAAPPVVLGEMNAALLADVRRFQDYDTVGFLQQDNAAFADTASAHRPRSGGPVQMPTDRTVAASAGFGGEMVEKLPGRVTNRQLRELLRLHYEDPAAWAATALGGRFGLDEAVVESILASVGPADVLEPRAMNEYPYGVWFERRA